ncbi:hypothetical protein THRCLA_05529 [Thraustotheca clavata]|uniref:RING-type domain-containing protein n=1 Tax=Thraustotheca clavata TaxID=74557 RepID=A0A1V9ZVT7_9STRA|nr:hypothetical protein THRCLA_05529 [Thraustotheca clavata]
MNFQRHDLVKVYKGSSLAKARVLHTTKSDCLVHYQGFSSQHDEWVPHYRVLLDTDLDDLHIQRLQIENKRLKDELVKTQAELKSLQATVDLNAHSLQQQQYQIVSDHCKKALGRLQSVLEEKQSLINSWNCVICLQTPINCALVPCGHTFCLHCAVQLTKCPICRQPSVSPLPIFKP